MCQRIIGPAVKLKEQWAWKVFGPGLKPFLYSLTGGESLQGRPYQCGRWYKSTGVKGTYHTCGGFHVFRTKRAAQYYRRWYGRRPVHKVRIRGTALPFEDGWAVHEMMIPPEGWKVGDPL